MRALCSFLILLAAPATAENSRPAAPASVHADRPAQDVRYPGVMTLDVDATNVAQRILRVRQVIPVAAPGPLTLRYPEWLPGKHAPRGPIASLAGLAIRADGKPVAWKRDPRDVYAFTVDVPRDARALDVNFDYLSPTETSQGRVSVTPEMLNLQWETVALYPAGHYTRQIRVRPSVTLPASWQGVAALDGVTRSGDTLRYGETDFETLVDSPMFAGRNYKAWDLGHSVRLNVFADRPGDLAATADQIEAHRRMVDQTVKLFGSRHYDRYEFLFALSTELGGIGLEHHRSSENALPRTYFTDWANTASMRSLLPHEFVHSWNGKFRRGADLWTPDYRTPMQNSLLWVYEGQTSYWDFVLAARSGLMPKDVVLGEIAAYAANYQLQPGRAWKPLLDTTNDPVTNARHPLAFRSWQRSEDYYNEGALIWLEADMLIREKTGGRKSLDDFARGFFGVRDGDWGVVTYTFEDVAAALSAVVPHDWATFLKTRVDEIAKPPLGGIEKSGYRLVFRETPNPYQVSNDARSRTADLSHSVGITVSASGVISNVVWDGPLFREGVTTATRIVAVNGREFNEADFRSTITAAKDGKSPIELLLKEGPRYRTIRLAYTGGLRYPHLERVGSSPAPLDRVLDPLR
ncbi:M61 family metallopeptidase [Sphingosinicella microcystinivorans]|uniref:M61 family metallopeptidase n=1 Tax=Sphingosinicella microcystinivorans TaxID=335406 RepID=UPI0022F3B018|nr:collagenase [Sphingosinicella microcystinivorans]WBX85255.1 collagenase [Sphingosinicella microcystinivorans]